MTSPSVDTGPLRDGSGRLQRVMKEMQRQSLEIEGIERRLDMHIQAREQFQRRLANAGRAIDLQAQAAGAGSRFLAFAAGKYEAAEDAVRKRTPKVSLADRLRSLLDQVVSFFRDHPRLALFGPGPLIAHWALSRHDQGSPATTPRQPSMAGDRGAGVNASRTGSAAVASAAVAAAPQYRYQAPDWGSSSYVHTSAGGENPNPNLRSWHPRDRGQCAWYVWGRAHELSGGFLVPENLARQPAT